MIAGGISGSGVLWPQLVNPAMRPDTENSRVGGSAEAKEAGTLEDQECRACSNRRYMDDSDDPGVSFQTPQHIPREISAAQVLAHELEHVHRESAKAAREGNEVVTQTVVLHGDVCPECGKAYVSGGETTTVVKETSEEDNNDFQSIFNNIGKNVDVFA